MIAIPVDLDALSDALQNTDAQRLRYLHLESGAILWRRLGAVDLAMQKGADGTPLVLRIEPVPPDRQYTWLQGYLAEVEDPVVRRALAQTIQGLGAFRRFREAIRGYPAEREKWRAFRARRVEQAVEQWLEARAIVPIPAPTTPVGGAPIDAARAGAWLAERRARLSAVSSTLELEELEACLAAAEFMLHRARRYPTTLE